MANPLRWALRLVLTLSPEEVSVRRRGFFDGGEVLRSRLEGIGRTVLVGHHAALESRSTEELIGSLEAVELEQRGFAYEGAAMGLVLVDLLTRSRLRRWRELCQHAGDRHGYMLHVGAGLAWARLRRALELPVPGFDPLLGALVADGHGFHAGYFGAARTTRGQPRPARLRGYAARAYDQGLGRSLWFVHAAEPTRIRHAIDAFDADRRPHLWSGVGLACAYAGGLDRARIETLRDLSETWSPDLAQGAAFAAEARRSAGNSAAHTRLACVLLCGRSDDSAADLVRRARQDLSSVADGQAYEEWRARVREALRVSGAV